jgi:hypothetical protein
VSEYIPDWELMSSQALVRLSAVCVPARFFTEIGQACGCLIRSSANDLGSRYADRQHVERAHAKMEGRALRCRFAAWDFLVAPLPEGPFQFVSTAVAFTCSMNQAKGSGSRHKSLPRWCRVACG